MESRVSDASTPLMKYSDIVKKRKSKLIPRDNLFKCPPNIEQAKLHGIANRISYTNEDCVEYCHCCGFYTDNFQFPITQPVESLAFLGVTFPLYFQFIKKCALLFLVQFLLSSLYNLLINLDGSEDWRSSQLIYASSIINNDNKKDREFQGIHNFVNLLIFILLIEFFKINQENSRYEIEQNETTPADFTLQIAGLHKESCRETIQNLFKANFREVEICDIYFLLNMEPYGKALTKKLALISERNHKIVKNQSLGDVEIKLNEIEIKLQNYARSISSNIFTQVKNYSLLSNNEDQRLSNNSSQEEDDIIQFTGRVLITLNDANQCSALIEKYRMSIWEWIMYWMYRRSILRALCLSYLERFRFEEKNLLRIKRAGEPSDINWMNVGSSRITYRFFINFAVLAVFFCSYSFVFGIKFLSKRNPDVEIIGLSSIDSIIISLLVSTVVAITNTLIGIIIRHFAGRETHKKQTNYFVSVGKRLSYLFFLNMVVTTYVANTIMKVENENGEYYRSWKVNEGMINDFFFLFITNTYLSSIFNYFDIMWGVRLIKRQIAIKQGPKCPLSQLEANTLFEGHPVDMALRYANVMKVMFFTAAISPILPIGLPMSLAGLFILYWVDKYLLLRRNVSKNYLDRQLATQMMEILPNYTVFFSLGNQLIFVQDKKEHWFQSRGFYLAFLGVVIALTYRTLFQFAFFKKLYFQMFKIRVHEKNIQQTYNDLKHKFKSTYESYHPVFREHREASPIKPHRMIKHIETHVLYNQ